MPAPLYRLERLGFRFFDRASHRRELYKQALESQELTDGDYLTIHDLLCLGHLPDGDAPLEMLLVALFAALHAGNLCIPLQDDALRRYLPEFTQASSLLNDFFVRQQQSMYEQVLATEITAYTPLIMRTMPNQQTPYLYFQRYAVAAETIQQRVTALCRPCATPPTTISSEIAAVLAPEQREAVEKALSQHMTVITGGPGTGKTTLVFRLLHCLVRAGLATAGTITLAAPTGRAAQRMTERIRELAESELGGDASEREYALHTIEGQTIHRLLGYLPANHGFTHDYEHRLAVDVLVVDEVSMIDATLMAALLQAVPDDCRVILLGDPHQLPSVDAGAVLADLLPDDKQACTNTHVARLTTCFRSERGILDVAELVNHYTEASQATLLTQLAGTGTCRLHDATGETYLSWQQVLADWGSQYYPDGEYQPLVRQARGCDTDALDALFERIHAGQILTVTRDGRHGCIPINRELCRRLATLPGFRTSHGWCEGTPVMVTRNAYGLRLFNGDTGVLLAAEDGSLRALFPRGHEYVSYPLHALTGLIEPAFAITVHKSQGSEYGNVLLVLPSLHEEGGQRLLVREIVYTGLTRAKDTAVIYGTPDTLIKACHGWVERDSGMYLFASNQSPL